MEKEIICFEEKELPINLNRISMQEGGSYRGMHAHVAIEVVVVQRGELLCYINEDAVMVGANQILLINSNIGHKLSSKNAEVTYLQIDTNWFKEENHTGFANLQAFVSRTKAKPYMLFENSEELHTIVKKIIARYNEKQAHSRWYLRAHLYELIAFMYARGFIAAATLSFKQLKKIKDIVDYIDLNFKTQITLNGVCAAVKYNRYTVCHTFKEITGATIFAYINFLRIHSAVEKLRETRASILEIATECGFSSATYFNRVFNSIIGCSPSVYRKLFAENLLL